MKVYILLVLSVVLVACGEDSNTQSMSAPQGGSTETPLGGVQAEPDADIPPAVPSCGDGRVNGAEICDDGNDIEGDGCDTNCTISACGNEIKGGDEACDDGNQIDGDGCDSNCTETGCGNGIKTGGEECDDGNLADGDDCTASCTLPIPPAVCGDGIESTGEQCDDGNTDDGDGCDSNCTPTGCGNSIITDGEVCDDGMVSVAMDAMRIAPRQPAAMASVIRPKDAMMGM